MRSLTIEHLNVGDAVESSKTISESDVYLFAGITGDFNPLHVDAEFARTSRFGQRVAHGPITLSLSAGLLGMELPGVGTIAVSNQIDYRLPVFIGDTVTTRVEVAALDPERRLATMALRWKNQRGELVADGTAVVKPPKTPAL